jgi:hypothetical protein
MSRRLLLSSKIHGNIPSMTKTPSSISKGEMADPQGRILAGVDTAVEKAVQEMMRKHQEFHKSDMAASEARILTQLRTCIPRAAEKAVEDKLRKHQALKGGDMGDAEVRIKKQMDAMIDNTAAKIFGGHQPLSKFIADEAICEGNSDQVLVVTGRKATTENSAWPADDWSKQTPTTELAGHIQNATARNGGSQLVYLVKGGDLKGLVEDHYRSTRIDEEEGRKGTASDGPMLLAPISDSL